jgi:NADPH:quinone reductase-like Zn-dependent oxidoreductase
MQMAPINPADINKIEGRYGVKPELPAVGGIEGVGLIDAVGAGVDGLSDGTQVLLPPDIGTWRNAVTLPAENVLPLPVTLPPEKGAMLGVNPSTAYLMLKEFVDLEPGDWVIQNAGNSNVGLCVSQIAAARGLKTISVARREEVFDTMKKHGADEVLLDDENVVDRVKELCGKNRPKLALNAVGGESALRIASCLDADGFHVTYGAMGKTPFRAPASLLIFKNITFCGFWVTRWKKTAGDEAMKEMLHELAHMKADGKLTSEIDTVYPLEDVVKALEHAQQGKRSGKVLLNLE